MLRLLWSNSLRCSKPVKAQTALSPRRRLIFFHTSPTNHPTQHQHRQHKKHNNITLSSPSGTSTAHPHLHAHSPPNININPRSPGPATATDPLPNSHDDLSRAQQQHLNVKTPGLMPALQDAILRRGVKASTVAQEGKIPKEIEVEEASTHRRVTQHPSGFVPPTPGMRRE